MPSDINVRVERAIAEKVFPGCVIGVAKKDGMREVLAVGTLRYEGGEKVTEDTVYDLASVTKSIPVASLALILIAEGKLRSSDKVKTYLPELKNDHDATIEDLLCYRVHGPRFSTLSLRTFEEIRTHILERGFDGPPKENLYSNLPAFLLGLIIESIRGSSLALLGHKHFFEPLEMKRTTFFPSPSDCAPTEIVDEEEVRGVVHDESARVFARARRTVGHAGLFSTAPDMLNFLEALLQGKYTNIVDGAQKGSGWQLSQEWFMGKNCGPRTFGKTGFTGTSVVCDMGRGVALVILSNRTFPTRPPDAMSLTSAINVFRCDIADILLSC